MNGLKGKFLINVTGALIGIAIALVTVPLYVSRIGESRYGILSLVWVMLGYMGFLDFGLSRATANALAKMNDAPNAERSTVFSTSLTINAALGTLGGLIIYFGGGYVLMMTRDLSPALRSEIEQVMLCIAPMLPLALMAGVGIGALEARERFMLANVLQITSNGLSQVVPLLAAIFIEPTLTVVIPAILIVRTLSTLIIIGMVMISERLHYQFRPDRARMKNLLGYGVWVTVTNLISPILTSIDQFVISTFIGAPYVARYAVPMTISARLQLFNSSLARTVFPRFSRLERQEASALAAHSMVTLAYLSAMLFAPALVVVHPFFDLWMGPEFASYSIPVARTVFIGAWLNGLAFIPFSLLQAQGRPDLVAKMHLLEILPYLALLWLLVEQMGLNGAALAWSLRVSADFLLLSTLIRLPVATALRAVPAFGAILIGLWLGQIADRLPLQGTMAVATVLSLATGALGLVVEPKMRETVRGIAQKLSLRRARA